MHQMIILQEVKYGYLFAWYLQLTLLGQESLIRGHECWF